MRSLENSMILYTSSQLQFKLEVARLLRVNKARPPPIASLLKTPITISRTRTNQSLLINNLFSLTSLKPIS